MSTTFDISYVIAFFNEKSTMTMSLVSVIVSHSLVASYVSK